MTHARLSLALGLALATASFAALAQNPESIDKVNGAITAAASQTYGDLETVNGSIRIESNAKADEVETVNGSINASDNIRVRSLATVNGSIKVGTQAHPSRGCRRPARARRRCTGRGFEGAARGAFDLLRAGNPEI